MEKNQNTQSRIPATKTLLFFSGSQFLSDSVFSLEDEGEKGETHTHTPYSFKNAEIKELFRVQTFFFMILPESIGSLCFIARFHASMRRSSSSLMNEIHNLHNSR